MIPPWDGECSIFSFEFGGGRSAAAAETCHHHVTPKQPWMGHSAATTGVFSLVACDGKILLGIIDACLSEYCGRVGIIDACQRIKVVSE